MNQDSPIIPQICAEPLVYWDIFLAIYFLRIIPVPNYFYSQSECPLHFTIYIHVRHSSLQFLKVLFGQFQAYNK